MGVTYIDAVSLAFGSREFTVGEFRRRIGTPRAARLLSELKTRGLVKRTARATYRVLGPGERPDRRPAEWSRVRNVILTAPMVKAWAGSTAVAVWTDERYRTDASPFRRTFHVAVRGEDLVAWHDYLDRAHVPTGGGKHIGAHVRLDPRPDLDPETVDGEPVVSRDEIRELIREHPALYAGAEELLRA